MNQWDSFAKKDAEYYILTHEKVDYKTVEGQKYFFESGQKFTQETLNNVTPYLKAKEKCLEIGCGIGRLTFAHATFFKEVVAVDVSETMLNKLNTLAAAKSITNIQTFLPHETWDKPDFFNYVYSFIVFQHIEEFEIIENYINRIAKALSNEGVAQLHFETRHQNIPYRIRNNLPDFVLPRSHRSGIRRIRRNADSLKKVFTRCNLKIITEISPNSPDHIFILKKAI